MPHSIEPALSGRARCRSCKSTISKGELRFGEAVAQVFGDGDAKHWYHLDCGAERRPEAFLEALAACSEPVSKSAELERRARLGVQHPRWTRIVRLERASSGRARCRHCKELIEKEALRLVLEIVEDGMANPAGFVHPSCLLEYAGTVDGVLERVSRVGGLEPADRDELEAALASTAAAAQDSSA